MKISHYIFIILFFSIQLFQQYCSAAMLNSTPHQHTVTPLNLHGFSAFKRINLTSGTLIIEQVDSPLKRNLTVKEHRQDDTPSKISGLHEQIIGDSLYILVDGGVKTDIEDYVTYSLNIDSIEEIIVSGSGKIIMQGPFRNVSKNLSINMCGKGSFMIDSLMAKHLTLNISGIGDIQISDLYCIDLQTKIGGTGNVIIDNGYAANQNVFISGNGVVNTSGLQGSQAKIKIIGPGKAMIAILNHLAVTGDNHENVFNVIPCNRRTFEKNDKHSFQPIQHRYHKSSDGKKNGVLVRTPHKLFFVSKHEFCE